jgi:lysyl-tRNA synthetase class 2
VGYDPQALVLELEFHKGAGVYQYFEVPTAVHTELISAASKGHYFNAHIKSAYRFERVD